jgi:hypothetical protein
MFRTEQPMFFRSAPPQLLLLDLVARIHHLVSNQHLVQ